jgi:glucokinase
MLYNEISLQTNWLAGNVRYLATGLSGIANSNLNRKGPNRMCKAAFTNKRRFNHLLSKIPMHVIVKPDIALFGAACHGFEQLETS